MWNFKNLTVLSFDKARIINPTAIRSGTEKDILSRAKKCMWELVPKMREAFEGKRVTVTCPLTGEEASMTGSMLGKNGIELYLFFSGACPFVMHVPRQQGETCFFPNEGIIITFSGGDDHVVRPMLKPLRNFLNNFEDFFEDYLQRKKTNAFVIGDFRPSHFLSQSLNAIEIYALPALDKFLKTGGIILIIKDHCFIDPRLLFPKLRQLPCLEVHSSEVSQLARSMGLLLNRQVRDGSQRDFTTAKKLIKVGSVDKKLDSNEIQVWISLDAEKERFTNQEVQIANVIIYLIGICAYHKKTLHVLWDGWTVPQDIPKSSKDNAVLKTIKGQISTINSLIKEDFHETNLFEMPLIEKLRAGNDALMAICSPV